MHGPPLKRRALSPLFRDRPGSITPFWLGIDLSGELRPGFNPRIVEFRAGEIVRIAAGDEHLARTVSSVAVCAARRSFMSPVRVKVPVAGS